MKKILFIFDRNISSLPPLLALIDSLIDSYQLVFIIKNHEEVIERLYQGKNIEFMTFNRPFLHNSLVFRAYNRVKRHLFFRRIIPLLIKQGNYDLVWIASAEAAALLGVPVNGIKYILNIYELYDTMPYFLKKIKLIAQRAHKVIVPEFNRANILRFWLDLKETPIIIPNKPITLPKYIGDDLPFELKSIKDKKIILYQGHIIKVRNLDALCEAVSNMPDYVVVLMGKSSDHYLDELKSKYPDIIHIGFIAPPYHLNVTSHAYIGVVTYGYFSLNHVFCAPNKIWEYSGYGVPMIANRIPGLIYTVEKNNAGCCVDMNNSKEIRFVIESIDTQYQEYSKSCKKMFNSIDVKEYILSIVNNCI